MTEFIRIDFEWASDWFGFKNVSGLDRNETVWFGYKFRNDSEIFWFLRNQFQSETFPRELKLVHKLQLEEEAGTIGQFQVPQRRQVPPPSLPSVPPNLTSQQLKRRHIVDAIVRSENSYVSTLQRLVLVSFQFLNTNLD